MIKEKNKLFVFLLIFIISCVYIYKHAIFERSDIKEVLETFIKTDYYYNGGKNDFSTVGNEQLKRYLIARNDVKNTHNKRNYKKVLSQNFEFKYNGFKKINSCVKVKVYMLNTYTFENEDTGEINDAGTGNNYTVYLSKINGEWKVMSATIDLDSDADAVDEEFDVNKELGYEGELNQNNIDENLNKMLKRLNDLKEKYSKPLK